MKSNILKYIKQLQHHERKSLGYESTLDFQYGYICCLLTNKLITKKEYNNLLKVYSYINDNDESGRYYFDDKGNFLRQEYK